MAKDRTGPFGPDKLDTFADLWNTEKKRQIREPDLDTSEAIVSVNMAASEVGVLARLVVANGQTRDIYLNPVAAARLTQALVEAGKQCGWLRGARLNFAKTARVRASDVL